MSFEDGERGEEGGGGGEGGDEETEETEAKERGVVCCFHDDYEVRATVTLSYHDEARRSVYAARVVLRSFAVSGDLYAARVINA